jgi:hypothetical protein
MYFSLIWNRKLPGYQNLHYVHPKKSYSVTGRLLKKDGLSRDLNPGPPAPKAGIIPLDHWAAYKFDIIYNIIKGKDPDADPGSLKTYGSYGSGSGTLQCLLSVYCSIYALNEQHTGNHWWDIGGRIVYKVSIFFSKRYSAWFCQIYVSFRFKYFSEKNYLTCLYTFKGQCHEIFEFSFFFMNQFLPTLE